MELYIGHVGALCCFTDTIQIHFPTRWGSSTLYQSCQGSRLQWSLDWTWRADDMASLISRSYAIRFLSIGVHQGHSVRTPVVDLVDLHRRVENACQTVSGEMLQNTWQEVEYGHHLSHKRCTCENLLITIKLGKFIYVLLQTALK